MVLTLWFKVYVDIRRFVFKWLFLGSRIQRFFFWEVIDYFHGFGFKGYLLVVTF